MCVSFAHSVSGRTSSSLPSTSTVPSAVHNVLEAEA